MKESKSNRKKKVNESDLLWHANIIRPSIEKIITTLDYKLEKLFFVKENEFNYLRVTISHPNHSISLDDCELVSREVGSELDKKDPIPFSYMLEVESPGVDITRTAEFQLDHEDMHWQVRLCKSS